MNLPKYLKEKDSFFKIATEFIKVESGKSKTEKYTFFVDNKKYFLKVFNGNTEDKLNEIYEIYTKYNIPTPKLVYLKYFSEIDKTCLVNEYIKGKTLLEVMEEESVVDLENLAFRIGKTLQQFPLSASCKTDIIITMNNELEELKKNAINLQNQVNDLAIIDLRRIFDSLEINKKYVYSSDSYFIHGDITFNNILISNDNFYLIDIESGRESFRILNFKGNWWWTWNGTNILKEQAIYRGIYKGLFDAEIPKKFHKELGFTMIYTFLSRLNKYRENTGEVQYTFSKFKEMFDNTNYFENYYFSWF